MRKLANDANVDAEALLEEFEERASIIEYLGEEDRATANARAFDLVRARVLPQTDMFEAA